MAPPVLNKKCSIEDCEHKHYGRGWCRMHWKRWRRHGDPLFTTLYRPYGQRGQCQECDEPAWARGLCQFHRHRAEKQEIINAYGGSCACCGETALEFLSIDHINGGGKQHRQNVSSVYADLKRRKFPQDDYRLLCMNCNFSVGQYNYCPHRGAQ